MAEIFRLISNGRSVITEISDEMSKRPLVKGSDITSLLALAQGFGFVEVKGETVTLLDEGRSFLNYVDSFANSIEDPDMNHKITDTLQRIQGYTDNEEVRGLADKVLEMGRKFVESFPDVGSYETRVTVTLPPNKRIPLEIRGSSLLNEEAEKNVIRDCKEKLYVVTPYLEVEVLQMLLNQSDTSSAECTIITSDEKRIVSDSRNLNKLRTVLKQRFRSAKILFLKDAMIVAHAKIWLCERSVLITSANVMSNSQTNNFEMGVYTDNPQIVKTCDTLISEILPLCKAI